MSALVVTTLSVAPAAAVACETFCVDHDATPHGSGHSSEQASGHEAAHAAHVHGAAVGGTVATMTVAILAMTSGAHDCNSHDRIAAPPSTLARSTSFVDSPAVVFFELGSAARGMVAAVMPVGTTHGPPGTPAATTVSVLRI